MNIVNYYRRFVLLIVIFLGIFLGIVSAALWSMGMVNSIHSAMPFAMAITLLIFGLTPMLSVLRRPVPPPPAGAENPYHAHMMSSGGYVRTIMVSALVFLLFGLVFEAMTLATVVKIILAFIAGSAIWVMLLAFVAYIFGLSRRV